MFPPSLRNPSHKEILSARAKDDAELQSLTEEFNEYVKDIEAKLPHATIGDLSPLRQLSSDLLRHCGAIGAKADEVQSTILSIDETIATQILAAIESTSPKQVVELRAHYANWCKLRDNAAQPFMVQCGRKDAPFGKDEVVAALLCEPLETVQFMIEMMRPHDPEQLKSWHLQAMTLASEAKKQGFDIPAIRGKTGSILRFPLEFQTTLVCLSSMGK